MKAVADSSVLISLSAIGQHTLLLRRFPSGILIPKAVWQEVVESGQGRSGAGEIACMKNTLAGWPNNWSFKFLEQWMCSCGQDGLGLSPVCANS